MIRLLAASVLALIGLAAPPGAAAQPRARLPSIGVLFMATPATAERALGFERGLRELGYVDGRNVVIEWRDAAGRPDRLAALAADLVQKKVDVIMTGGPGPLAAARAATDSVPIVTVGGSDPIEEGWAKSLARPGGNVTGLTVTFPGIGAKRLDLLKEMLPSVVHVGVLLSPAELPVSGMMALLEGPARRLGLQLQVLEVREPADFDRVFRTAQQDRVQAILTLETPFIIVHRQRLADLALQQRMPWIAEFTAFGADGMVLAYGANINDLLRRAATHVDRILKGAHAADLPIERPTEFDLTINLRTARAIGVTVPQSLLLRADRVIE